MTVEDCHDKLRWEEAFTVGGTIPWMGSWTVLRRTVLSKELSIIFHYPLCLDYGCDVTGCCLISSAMMDFSLVV